MKVSFLFLFSFLRSFIESFILSIGLLRAKWRKLNCLNSNCQKSLVEIYFWIFFNSYISETLFMLKFLKIVLPKSWTKKIKKVLLQLILCYFTFKKNLQYWGEKSYLFQKFPLAFLLFMTIKNASLMHSGHPRAINFRNYWVPEYNEQTIGAHLPPRFWSVRGEEIWVLIPQEFYLALSIIKVFSYCFLSEVSLRNFCQLQKCL